jgi:hypothetical protein
MDGRVSTDKVQQSFPLATVTVFDAGTLNLSTIFSTEGGAPLANPFIADSDGHWGFWADQARYDVQFSDAGITTPYTLFNLQPNVDVSGLADPGSNGFLARTSLGVTAARTFLGTTSEIVVLNGTGGANPTWSLDTGLNFSGKTISGGTFIGPSITTFASAQHDHDDAAGGGQLNATNVFSAGTVPVARLPIMVGASGVANGVAGLVTQPLIGDESRFLRGDGTWQTAGGGGGTPGGANTTIQYNNVGAFGGVSGVTSDGTNITFGSTNLRATRPRFVTSIDDTNGNELFGISAVGSAINEFTIANAAIGGHPVISATGGDANINIVLTPKGSGIITTAGNLQISNNAPQIVLIDVNDSKTVRMSLSGANWDFINDTLGSVPIRIDTTNNNISLTSQEMSITNATVPHIRFVRSNATARTVDVGIDNADNFVIVTQTVNTPLSVAMATGVATFVAIPVLPASNPTTANQAVRKQYVDDRVVSFSAAFLFVDPTVATLNNFGGAGTIIIPAGGTYTVTKFKVAYTSGSHTSGGSVTFTIDQAGVGSRGTLTLDNTNNTAFVVYENNVGDFTVAENVILSVYVSARSGTVSERNVTVTIEGHRTLF